MPFRVVGINTGVTSGYLTGSPQHPREYAGNDCSSDEYLQVNSCGIFDKLAESSRTFRPEGRRDYQILFVESVGVRMQTPGGEIMLSAGDMILLAPHVCHDYRYLQGCTAIWVHFTGRGVRALLKQFEMEPFVKYSITDTGPFLMLAEKIIREYRFRHVGFESISSAYLVQMLTLAKRRIDASAGDRPLGPPDLSPAFEDMQIDFAKNRELSDYAKMCGISTSYFISCFTKEYGMPPYRYLTQIRISQAKHLLLETGFSISEIARSVGYADPFCFSRIFRKYAGMSPSEFRCSTADKANR